MYLMIFPKSIICTHIINKLNNNNNKNNNKSFNNKEILEQLKLFLR